MSQAEFSLAGEFPPARREDWLKLVSAALKGAPFEQLVATTYDGVAPAAVDLRFGLDPLGLMATRGSSAKPWNELAAAFADWVKDLARQGFQGPFVAADGRPVEAAEGWEAPELACALASAVAYLRTLETAGVALEDARRMIFFRLAADADEFLTIAKFGAVRRLWARVEAACGLRPEPAFVSAETAWRMMTKQDPWVNLLRATVAVFSAGLGGANAVSLLPFTAALGLPDGFARRIARNTQLVLLEEANLAKVADPAAGSGALEDLTGKLCSSAWSLFREIEARGGLAAALEQGLIQQKIARVRAEREKAVAVREDVLTGTRQFPDVGEVPVAVLDVAPVQLPPPAGAAIRFEPPPRLRLSEPYERLRERSDRLLRDTGARPNIFLANLGPLAAFTARAMWAKNLFEAGGIEAATNDGFLGKAADGATDLDALIAAFRASGAKLACICSSDEVYLKQAQAAARALANAGAPPIYLPGRPREAATKLRDSWLKTFR